MNFFSVFNNCIDLYKVLTHPVIWFRDKIKSWLIKTVISNIVLKIQSESLNIVFKKVENFSYTISDTVSPPKFVREYLLTDDGLSFLNKISNELLEKPLFLIGYKLGNVHFERVQDDLYNYFIEFKFSTTSAISSDKK